MSAAENSKEKPAKNEPIPLGGQAIGPNHEPIICVNCSPKPLDYSNAVAFRVLKIGISHAQSKYKPDMDIAQCPRCGKTIAY